jgi:septal ring factor EnvC (AmiA/AmiB activator)
MARLATQRARQNATVRLKPPEKSLPTAPSPDGARNRPVPRVASLPPSFSAGLPVRGRVHRVFGAIDDSGRPSKGITIKTRPGSAVVAPRDGVVVFAGPFRGLGRLLIIEYQAKYHLLLAGLARIDTAVGEEVLAGEPVGMMEASQDAESALYMELRRDGQPINPLPWLAAGRTRVNG